MNTYLYFARIDTTVNSTSSTDWAKGMFQNDFTIIRVWRQSRFEQQWTHTPHQDYYHGVRISVCHHISCHHISLSRVPRIGAIYRCCWGQEQAWNPRLDYDKITIEQDVRLGIIINFRGKKNLWIICMTHFWREYLNGTAPRGVHNNWTWFRTGDPLSQTSLQSRLVTRQARRDTHVCQRH